MRAKRSKRAVESFFSQSYGKPKKKRNISETVDFFFILLVEQKEILFDRIIDMRADPARPNSTRPNPALTLFDGSQPVQKIRMLSVTVTWLSVLNLH